MNSYLQMCVGENHHVIRIHRSGWDVHFFPKDRSFDINPEAVSPNPDHDTYFQAELLQVSKMNLFPYIKVVAS